MSRIEQRNSSPARGRGDQLIAEQLLSIVMNSVRIHFYFFPRARFFSFLCHVRLRCFAELASVSSHRGGNEGQHRIARWNFKHESQSESVYIKYIKGEKGKMNRCAAGENTDVTTGHQGGLFWKPSVSPTPTQCIRKPINRVKTKRANKLLLTGNNL